MEQRPLLILDIDETLIHGRETPLDRECDFRAGEFYIYLRPNVKRFLGTVSEFYDLACWSAASKDYLDVVLNELMSGLDCSLRFIWDRSRCTRRVDFVYQEEYFLKDLKKVKRKGFDLTRVLILEDEPRKVHRHFGNAIYVKPFEGAEDDDELLKLGAFLESIRAIPDFRQLEKRFWRSGTSAK